MDFPGGLKVRADLGQLEVLTDQPVRLGGEGSAPAPFDLFLASIGTCAGIYALQFLRRRKLPTEGVRLILATEEDAKRGMLSKITIRIVLPDGFPEKYRDPLARAVELCTVKRHILDPPRFETIVETAESQPVG
jgi:ribosomal protein S12 methylthiotransferase accessory factor